MILRRKLQNGETNQQLDDLIANLPENNDHIANYILQHNGQLPPQPMFEKHPYLDTFELQNFEKYIIGTFPPISYIFDHPVLNENNIGQNQIPNIPFFHGNMISMWKYLFTNEEFQILNELVNNNERFEAKNHIINKLNELKINYSDIIKNTRRKVFSYKDEDLYNIKSNLDLINQILVNPNAKYLNFNTSTLFNTTEIGVRNRNWGQYLAGSIKELPNSYNLFLVTLQSLGFTIEISHDENIWYTINQNNAKLINHHFKNKISTKLRISIKELNKFNFKLSNVCREFVIITTPSPSDGASIPLVNNHIFINWLQNQPQHIQTPTIQFRKYIYQLFRNNDWDALQAMNINI